MATAYNRRKQPELIRRLLLDCAATLALEPVQRALEGRAPRQVIVVPTRIIKIVV